MASYKTPGVYVEEVSTLPPSVAEVSTAVPVFIGYTERSGDLRNKPVKINTLLEFDEKFGKPFPAAFEVATAKAANGEDVVTNVRLTSGNRFLLYYSLKLFFDNGGGGCYIISTGSFSETPTPSHFEDALSSLEKEDEPTLIVLTDAVSLAKEAYYNLCKKAIDQCAALGDRFLIADVIESSNLDTDVADFRDNIGTNHLKYAAAYAPYVQTLIPYQSADDQISLPAMEPVTAALKEVLIKENAFKVTYSGTQTTPRVQVDRGRSNSAVGFEVTDLQLTISNTNSKSGRAIADAWSAWTKVTENNARGFNIIVAGDGSAFIEEAVTKEFPAAPRYATLASLKDQYTALYNKIKAELAKQKITLPPSAAVAGIYARTDRERGVWKAPANVSLNSVLGPTRKINDKEQENLNIDAEAGKSINAIRSFTGKGTLVWGARTLAGNDNEWRYVSVRRLFNLIEESTKKSTAFAVFEPNDATTWLKVKAMIDSYLYGLWQQGALAGASPETAYYVNIGLGKTMTTQDVLEGKLIVEIGVAAVRPAEFIILRFMHKLREA
jgi:hypothetical protein